MSLLPPNWLGGPTLQPIVVLTNAAITSTIGNGFTTLITSPNTLQPGTYLVGANFAAQSTTTFTNTDTIYFRIFDTAGNVSGSVIPMTLMSGYSQQGSSNASIYVTVSGLITLTIASTLSFGTNATFTLATGKTGFATSPYYQRLF
jgi:hypothetical protein